MTSKKLPPLPDRVYQDWYGTQYEDELYVQYRKTKKFQGDYYTHGPETATALKFPYYAVAYNDLRKIRGRTTIKVSNYKDCSTVMLSAYPMKVAKLIKGRYYGYLDQRTSTTHEPFVIIDPDKITFPLSLSEIYAFNGRFPAFGRILPFTMPYKPSPSKVYLVHNTEFLRLLYELDKSTPDHIDINYCVGDTRHYLKCYQDMIAENITPYFAGIQFDIHTGKCLNPTKAIVYKDKRNEWNRLARMFKAGIQARSKLGVLRQYEQEVPPHGTLYARDWQGTMACTWISTLYKSICDTDYSERVLRYIAVTDTAYSGKSRIDFVYDKAKRVLQEEFGVFGGGLE